MPTSHLLNLREVLRGAGVFQIGGTYILKVRLALVVVQVLRAGVTSEKQNQQFSGREDGRGMKFARAA